MSFGKYKDKLSSALTNTGTKPTSLKDFGKVAVSLINNEFNRDEKTKKIINKALGTLEIDDLISDNSDVAIMNFTQMDLVSMGAKQLKKVDFMKKKATNSSTKKSSKINTKDVHGSVNKKKVTKEKEKIPSNNIPKGALVLTGDIPTNDDNSEPEVIFDIRKSVSMGTIYAYENDDKTPVIEITAFDYKFDKDNVAGNKPSTNNIFTVVLPLQSGFDISHSANYSDYNSVWYRLSNALGGLGQDIVNFDGDKAFELLGGIKDVATSGTALNALTIGALTTAGNALGLNMGQGGISAGFEYAKVATGTALNPMSISYYTNHNLIEHNFSFNLIPKNATDNRNIQKIIALLEEYQLAKMSDKLGGVMVSYPSVFQIQFKTHKNGKNINTIFDIPDSVLQNITVNWNGGLNFFSTNEDKNSPTSVNLTLSFKEMQMRTAVDMLALWR